MMTEMLGERYHGQRAPTWRSLGHYYATDDADIIRSMVIRGFNYHIFKRPLLFEADGNLVRIPNKYALVREGAADIMGIVGEDYKVVQNIEIAMLMRSLTHRWPVDTIGTYNDGQILFIALRAGRVRVGTDEVDMYFLITDKRSGGSSLKIAFTPLRIRCGNALVTTLKAASVKVAINHSSMVVNNMQARVRMIGQMEEAQGKTMEVLSEFTHWTITPDEAKKIIEDAFPYPKAPNALNLLNEFEDNTSARLTLGSSLFNQSNARLRSYNSTIDRINAQRDVTFDLYNKFNDENPPMAQTLWAVYNSVVEFSDWREGREAKSIAVDSLFGYRAAEKQRAFASAMSYIVQGG